jgi:hypothetical protein
MTIVRVTRGFRVHDLATELLRSSAWRTPDSRGVGARATLAAVASSVARDLTDSAENQAVLDCASALAAGGMTVEGIAVAHGAGVAAEAEAVCRSRARLVTAGGAVHVSVVWAMYGETGRMVTREEHPHGEDFVRVKARQLDWLTDGTGVTWSVVAVDDGCPDTPSSAEVMRRIVASEGYAAEGPPRHHGASLGGSHRRRAVDRACVRPADWAGAVAQGGSIVAGLAHALRTSVASRHVVAYTDADLSANLAHLGTLAAPILRPVLPDRPGDAAPAIAVLGRRYGMPEAVLVKPGGPVYEPFSTGGKPDKIIVLFRHAVRATLIPELAHVPDTQAGFKAFNAAALGTVLPMVSSFDETFDVELLIHSAQQYGAAALAIEPIVFTEDFAATNFPSVDPGVRHLAMIEQVVQLYDRLIAPTRPAAGEAAALLELVRGLDLDSYGQLIEGLRAEDAGNDTLFERRWPAAHLRALLDV